MRRVLASSAERRLEAFRHTATLDLFTQHGPVWDAVPDPPSRPVTRSCPFNVRCGMTTSGGHTSVLPSILAGRRNIHRQPSRSRRRLVSTSLRGERSCGNEVPRPTFGNMNSSRTKLGLPATERSAYLACVVAASFRGTYTQEALCNHPHPARTHSILKRSQSDSSAPVPCPTWHTVIACPLRCFEWCPEASTTIVAAWSSGSRALCTAICSLKTHGGGATVRPL